ncbi:hypothetical protein K438DRAFT_1796155 [Mycena galopus ATCC 62051]|nr:hypothetical protein K438DRAFT_1796155 [Mycena galopus ATCC 62051]
MSTPYLVSGLPHTALIVIDVQQAFIDPSFLKRERSTPNLESNITALLAAFRAKRVPIIHIHHFETVEAGSLWNETAHPEGVCCSFCKSNPSTR